MKKLFSVLCLVTIVAVSFSGCMTLTHQVGRGAQTGVETSAKQWYILWGLVPLNNVDSKQMAGTATDYTIQSQSSFIDQVIGAFTSIVTVSCQTVTVKK